MRGDFSRREGKSMVVKTTQQLDRPTKALRDPMRLLKV